MLMNDRWCGWRTWNFAGLAVFGGSLAACGGTYDEPPLGTVTSPAVRAEQKALGLGLAHTCVILSDRRVKCWGRNDYAQLGLGHVNDRGDQSGEMGDGRNIVLLGTRTALALAAGDLHTCALLNNNQVACWGSNQWGQLGIGDNSGGNLKRGDVSSEMGSNLIQVNLGAGRWARAIGSGASFSCALMDNNQIKCWGINTHGCLGSGDDGNVVQFRVAPSWQLDFGPGRWVKSFALGSYHGCAILDNNNVKCWGAGYLGQQGRDSTEDYGDAPNELNDGFVVPLGQGRTAKALDAGGHHTCAWLDNDSVKCWGANDRGQLGLGDIQNRGDGLDVYGMSEMGDALDPVVLPGIKIGLSAGRSEEGHTCAIGAFNEPNCWGPNRFGGLGLGHTDTIGDDEETGVEWTYLGTNQQNITYLAVAIATGGFHTCAVLQTGALKCWGANESGQLGNGDDGRTNPNKAAIGDQGGETGNGIPVVNVGN